MNAAKLELTPLAARVKGMFTKIVLWIDTDRDVSIQQQAFEPGDDYRLAKYTNIKLNATLPPDTFKLKTTSKTKVVHPQ